MKKDLTTPLVSIHFDEQNTRIRNCLGHTDIETLKDLCLLHREDLLRFRDLGQLSVKTIEMKLMEYGLKLGMVRRCSMITSRIWAVP